MPGFYVLELQLFNHWTTKFSNLHVGSKCICMRNYVAIVYSLPCMSILMFWNVFRQNIPTKQIVIIGPE